MNIHHVALIASVVALGMLMAFNAWALLNSRGAKPQRDAFVAQLIPDDGRALFCACLQGRIARYLIEYGPNVGGPMCLNCARAEFVAWCLQQCDKRLTRHAEEIDHLALEYNPDPPPPQKKQVQP